MLARLAGGTWWLARPVEVPGSRPLAFEAGPNIALALRAWPDAPALLCASPLARPISSAIRSGCTPGSLSSDRDVEERLAERGLDISYGTVRRWFLKFGPVIAADLRCARPRPGDRWRLDEIKTA